MLMESTKVETEYRWLEAAKLYEQSLQPDSATGTAAAECWQKIGFCYELASRQATSIDDFRSLRRLSSDAYKKASDLFSKESNQDSEGKRDQCQAQAEYAISWIAADSQEKTRALDKCWAEAKKAMQIFQASGNILSYGQTANLLTSCLFERLYAEHIAKEKTRIVQEATRIANDAISALSKCDSPEELIVAFTQASILNWYYAVFSQSEEERKAAADTSVNCAVKAIALSEKIQSSFYKALSLWGGVWSNLYFRDDIDISLKYAKEMLSQASIAKDNYFKGAASYMIADVTDQKVLYEANPNQRKQLYDEIIRNAVEAIHFLNFVFQDSLMAEAYMLPATTYCALASDFSVNRTEKLAYSRKAIEVGKKGLEHATRSCSPEAMLATLHGLSKACYYQSKLESDRGRKAKLLIEALGYRKEHIKIAEESFPHNLWVRGVGMVYAAQIETDQSRQEKDEKKKLVFLKDAIADMEQGVSLTKDWLASHAVPSFVTSVAGYEDNLGGTFDEGYSLTREPTNLTRANEVYTDAAEHFKKVDLPSRVAESYWKIAKNLDYTSDFDQAAKNFENAFASYKAAAQRIVQFSDFYLDYASYMKAWSEISFAKRAHNAEEYATATQYYEKSSQLLRQSKSWLYLSQNFYAWSLLEQAEDLSRNEKGEESIKAFEKAIKFLKESKRILNIKLGSVDKNDEKEQIQRLVQASDLREEYSLGRIAIEEARNLDKQGEHIASSGKYENAAAIFHKILLMDSDQTIKEAKQLSYLCQAWQRMTLAEARASPIMYEEAAELFELAKDNALKESEGLVAMGHSSFCKALEAGTEFEITHSMAMYQKTSRHMETASSYYLQAGFAAPADYAKATQRLLDAYVFMDSAKREREPKKQEKYYSMAEKVLLEAAEAFEKAKYFEKTDYSKKLLRKVREEKELALSLSDIFRAPVITASTESFSTISPVQESAAGLERFEHADIQAKLIQRETEVKIGQKADIEIQFLNVGKEPISLIRIENIVPQGFQIVEKPDYCQIDDSHLTMKGKRLDPLKPDEIKITLKPFKQGTIEIKPQIVCLDSTGHHVTYSPEPGIFNVTFSSLPNRVSTGCIDLDNLLFGGLPENYSVVLTSASSDERQLLIRRFLEAGAKTGQTTYYITAEIGDVADLAEKFQANFHLFVCNPRADVMIKDLPNLFKLKGVGCLTDIDIALIKSFRRLDASQTGPRRLCITILSDVLLEHHAVITRKWLGGLLPDLKARGFTTLAVVNPEMHPLDEVQAILGLFEGEIRISEKETSEGLEKTLRIRKLYNQKYLENELVLTKEKLEC
jgi:KaiC/GvpD/RAD55 family RecA-like ATPase